MSRHLIFLVHGAGTYTKDGKANPQSQWFLDCEKSIKDAFNSYPTLAAKDFDKNFQFHHIVYDDLFHQMVQAWQNNAKVYSPIFGAGSSGAKLVDFFKNAGKTTDNFLWTNAADLFLYAAFGEGSRLVRPLVIENVRAQLTTALLEKEPPSWSVIAHSLGTAVTHDVLSQMSQSDEFEAYGRAKAVAMIANLSKVLEDSEFGGKVYGSSVHPGGITEYYLSAVHAWDPVSLFQEFSPPGQPGWRNEDGFDKVHGLRHFVFDGPDATIPGLSKLTPVTHNFGHYFAHPKVHLSYFKHARSYLRITNKFINDAAVSFAQRQNKVLETYVRSRFDDIAPGGGGLEGLVDKLKIIFNRWS